jgi:fumarate reductase subunit D
MNTPPKDTNTQTGQDERKHWLYRSENLPKLWLIQIVILLLALLPEFFVHHHPHFEQSSFTLDTSFGFFAWYGFITCAGMVALAKILGIFLKRKDTYYDE